MPLIWQTDPTIRCTLVGSQMPEAVKHLAQPGVEIVGHVAHSTEVFDRVRLTVAPLRYGAGLKGRVLASLAAGIPCVMTPIAAEGLALPPVLQDYVGLDAASLAAPASRPRSCKSTVTRPPAARRPRPGSGWSRADSTRPR